MTRERRQSKIQNLRSRIAEEPPRLMWKNFATAIFLLGLALMAALYSSSAAAAGRLLPAGIASLIALSIAAWVGVRFVPRLAAGVDWDWLPFLSYYQVTREGWTFMVATLVVVFAAVNTSNNLLYMVLSAFLAVIVLSGFLSGLNFRYVAVRVQVPTHSFAREAFPLTVETENEKKFFPSFSLHVEPPEGSSFRFPMFYIPVLESQRLISRTVQAVLPRRGRYLLDQVKVHSRYPFGFFSKGKNFETQAECICYPEIIPLERLNLGTLDIQGAAQRFERGLGFDLYMIRNYQPSDTARHVDWKAYAKTGSLMTREYAAEESRRVVLLFDRYGEPQIDHERFEQLVSTTASLAFHLMGNNTDVALVSDDWQTGYGRSEQLLDAILQYLALVEMSPRAEEPWAEESGGACLLSLRRNADSVWKDTFRSPVMR